jgi:hypothetical protein
MNRKVLVLNFGLLCLAAICAWQLRVRWKTGEEHIRQVVGQNVPPARVLPPLSPESPKALSPAEYIDVAQKTLFSRDRNPNVVIEPPPPAPVPPPPPPMPALPFYHGQMSLGPQPVAVLSLKGNDQKGYHVGDMIGDFKLIAFDREKMVFDWEGKEVERKLADLKPKEPVAEQASSGPGGTNGVATPGTPPAIRALNGANAEKAPAEKQLGNDMGNGFRGCAPGDPSPAGTVVNGYKKVVSRALMGSSCYWEQVK